MENFLKYLLDESLLLEWTYFKNTDEFKNSNRIYGVRNPTGNWVKVKTIASLNSIPKEHYYLVLGLAKILLQLQKRPDFSHISVIRLADIESEDYKVYRVNIYLKNMVIHSDRDMAFQKSFANQRNRNTVIRLKEDENLGLFFVNRHDVDSNVAFLKELPGEDIRIKASRMRRRERPLFRSEINKDRSSYDANYPMAVCEYVRNNIVGVGEFENKEYLAKPFALLNITIKSIDNALESEIYNTRAFLNDVGLKATKETGGGRNKNWIYLTRRHLTNMVFRGGNVNDQHFYGHFLDTIKALMPPANARGADFNLDALMDDQKFCLMLATPRNPVRVVLSEILIPFLLAARFDKIQGNPIIQGIDTSLYKVTKVRFPNDNSNFLSDFSIVWITAEANGRVAEGMPPKIDYLISAKIGKEGHMPSLFSLLGKLKNPSIENTELLALYNIAKTKDLNKKDMLEKALDTHAGQFADEKEYVNYLNNLPGFLDEVYDLVFGFYNTLKSGSKEMRFQQIEMDVDSDPSGKKVKLTFNTIEKTEKVANGPERLVLRAGGNAFPLAIKLKRLPG